MAMSTHVIGFKPPDETWVKMKAIYDACEAADIYVPGEVTDYFEGVEPDSAGVEVSESSLIVVGALTEWQDKYRQGFEVDLTKLPKDITRIRFYNSW